MGAGGGKELPYGVAVNPRVNYANLRSKKENKIVRIDAKPLVHLKHGTVRYRYVDGDGDGDKKEKPFEGTELGQKHNYFYHQRFNTEGSGDDPWKYCYVYKGPERARQKRLFYVFGKGLKVNDNGFVESNYKPEEQSFQRPIFYKMDGHVYMDIIFLNHDTSQDEVRDEKDVFERKPSPLETGDDEEPPDSDSLTDIEVQLPLATTIEEICVKLARKLVKLTAHIHLYHKGSELRPEQKLSELTQKAELRGEVRLLLHPK